MSKKEYQAFPAVVCQRIRNLVDLRTKAETAKKKMREARDHARDEMSQLHREKLSGHESKLKQERLDADFGRCVRELERLNSTIKWADGEIAVCVEKADEPQLFSDADVTVPDFEAEDDDEEESDAPVGKPGTPKAKKGETPELKIVGGEQPEGWNQHLQASINELDVNDRAKQKLVDAGFVTIGQLYKFIEDGKNLSDKLNAGENVVSAVRRSVKEYVKKHTRADLEATRDGRGGVA
jgi:hypothetical protein